VRRLVLSACALRFFDTFLLIVPFYTVMFSERGLTPTQIGIVLAAWSVTGMALEVPCGVLADRTSRRWLLAGAQLFRCLGFLLWALFPGFWGFLFGLVLWAFKSATFNGAFEAVIYDELKALEREQDYAWVMGRVQAARAGGVLGASLAAAVVAPFGYPVLLAASFASGLMAAAAALTLPHAPKAATAAKWGYFSHLKEGARQAASLPGVAPLMIFIAAAQALMLSITDYWQLFARELGLSKSGIALFIGALSFTIMVVSTLAHRLKTLPLPALHLLFAATGAGLAASASITEHWALIGPVIFVALYWIVEVNADARFQHALRPETRATVGSLKGFAMQLTNSGLMLVFGVVAQAAGSYRALFLAAGVAALLWGGGFALATTVRGRQPA